MLFSAGCSHESRVESPPPEGMVLVPAGDFLAGSNDEDASDEIRPQRRRYVAAFYIDKLEVTNADYRSFRPDHTFPKGEDLYPVTHVTYHDRWGQNPTWTSPETPTF